MSVRPVNYVLVLSGVKTENVEIILLDNQLEGKRMASGIIGNDVPRKGLRVRVPCPPFVLSH